MTLDDLLAGRRDKVLAIARSHGVRKIAVCGSFARGDARLDSDLDLLLLEYGPERTPWFPAGLVLDLEDLLNRKVDVGTPSGIHPRIRDQVLKEAIPLEG